ncbi:nuclear transport factor 2 family protein [Kineococcus sp. SYSU DK005]|uniref:nuclear transport factor 2 family protein n=1 Tax=Kineococcus sp. SYSU DK005 TaxID=3383126 RepID=UPI003D7D094E
MSRTSAPQTAAPQPPAPQAPAPDAPAPGAGAQRAEAHRRLMDDYFGAMSAGGDFSTFFTEDVVWVETESGESFTGPAAVRERIEALHDRMFEARSHGRSLSVTDEHAFLEGEFVGTAVDLRVPFCLVYDLDGTAIRRMRLYMTFAPLRAVARGGADPAATAGPGR